VAGADIPTIAAYKGLSTLYLLDTGFGRRHCSGDLEVPAGARRRRSPEYLPARDITIGKTTRRGWTFDDGKGRITFRGQ
jgi:hypothetical protein